jgi:hypothetical protein
MAWSLGWFYSQSGLPAPFFFCKNKEYNNMQSKNSLNQSPLSVTTPTWSLWSAPGCCTSSRKPAWIWPGRCMDILLGFTLPPPKGSSTFNWSRQVHPSFKWLWKASAQKKHRFSSGYFLKIDWVQETSCSERIKFYLPMIVSFAIPMKKKL